MRYSVRVPAAGVAAAAGFACWVIGSYGMNRHGPWHPVNLIAHLAWRGAPTGSGFSAPATAVGLAIVLAAGIVMIVPFAALAYGAGLPAPATVLGAAVYTNAAWIIGDYIVWPKLDSVGAHGFSPGVAWLGHIVAGVAAGVVLVARPGLLRPAVRRLGSAPTRPGG
ncbi:hypothetical protein GCM10023322_74420 [Rugosimonospora acidiphila]|uniref:Uncharacterized protein n=1 Tax=Rugosimonospora acidiphila TaxID=556531 RepID=A0ABP9SQ29_9ACTN